jgi:hypothetical protein
MSSAARRLGPMLLAVAAAVALVVLYRRHQRDVAQEAARETPVVAPSRVREQGGMAVVTLDSAEVRRVGGRSCRSSRSRARRRSGCPARSWRRASGPPCCARRWPDGSRCLPARIGRVSGSGCRLACRSRRYRTRGRSRCRSRVS